MKRRKFPRKDLIPEEEIEESAFEPLPSPLAADPAILIAPAQSAQAYSEAEEGEIAYDVEPAKEIAETEEPEAELEAVERKLPPYPHDATWLYLKGLQKTSLLKPEREVELAKKIKEGEEMAKVLGTKIRRLETELYATGHPVFREGSGGGKAKAF